MKYKYLLFFFVSLLYVVCFNTSVLGQTAKPLTGDALTLKHNATYANPSSGFSTIFIDSGVVKVQRSDGTTKAAIFLTDLSATSPLSYNNGTGAFSLAGLSSLGTANYVVGVNSGATAWEYKQLIAGTNITITPGTGSITIDASGGGGATAFNDIGDATGVGTVANAANAQEWSWNTLAGASGLKLSSTSTAAASNLQRLFEVSLSGANGTSTQTTYAGYLSNTHTGTSSTNVGLYLNASGATNNYGLIVNAGRVGITTTTPLGNLDLGTGIDLKKLLLYGSGNTYHGFGLRSGETTAFYPTGSQFSIGAISTSDGSTFTERVRVNDSSLNLIGTSQNLLFQGSGAISFTSTAPTSKIDFQTLTEAQAILLYKSGNTRHGFGIGANQTRIFHPTGGAYTSIGALSTADGSTFTEYFRFNTNAGLDFTQGTITSSIPYINHTVTLNSGATTFQLLKSNVTNTASASASTFIDLQTSSTSRFKIDLSGQITTNEANGIVHNLGYLKVGHFFDAGTGYSGIANAAMTNLNTDYAVLQEGLGATFVNAKSGTSLSFRLGNTEYGLLSGTKWDFTTATTGVAKRNPHAAKTSNYTVLTTDSGGVFTNVNALGDVTFALPAASAGLEYHFYVTDNQNLIVDANGTDTIRIAASVSASGGNLTANTIGNSLTVRYISVGQWGVFASQGTWTVN